MMFVLENTYTGPVLNMLLLDRLLQNELSIQHQFPFNYRLFVKQFKCVKSAKRKLVIFFT